MPANAASARRRVRVNGKTSERQRNGAYDNINTATDFTFRGRDKMGYASDLFKIFTAAGMGGMAWNNEESEAAIANFASAGVSTAFLFGKNYGSAALKNAYKQEMWILEVSIVVLQLAEIILLGNANEKGEKFKTASKDFELAHGSLEDAIAQPRDWSGEAADNYNKLNTEQTERVQTMIDLDLQVPPILKTEAAQVKKLRAVSSECRLALSGCIPIAYYILATYGPISCLMFQSAASGSVMSTAGAHFGFMVEDASDNAKAIKNLMDQYQAVLGEAAEAVTILSPTGSPAPKLKGVASTTVSEFKTLSGAPASAAYMSAPAVASAGSDSEPAPLMASAVSAAGDDSAADDPGVQIPDDEMLPPEGDAPTYTMPTFSQAVDRASQASTQAAKFSADAAETVSLVNEVIGTVDQINTMVQSAPPPEPAPVEEAEAQDVDRAATGVENAERAPVDVAAGDAENVERTL